MLKRFSLLASFLIVSITATAQTYEEQYAKCSELLPAINEEIEPSYFEHLCKRDVCLQGTVAPNFSAATIDGQQIELSKLRGKVVVLNFWFTKCQPCIAEMPDLNQLADHYAGKEVAFISFAPEEKAKLEDFFQKHPFKFTTVPQSESIRRDVFKLFSIWPYAVIIDREGKISRMWFGKKGIPEGTSVFDHYKQIIDPLLKTTH